MPTLLRVNSFVFSIQKSKTNYMNDKTKNVLKWLPSFIIACQLSVSAILKFTGFPFLVQSFSEIGLAGYLGIRLCRIIAGIAVSLSSYNEDRFPVAYGVFWRR